MQTYTFGNSEAVLAKLVAASLMPVSDILEVLKRFAANNGGQKRNAHGVNIGFQLAIVEVARRPGAVPMLAGMMNLDFEDLMTALFDDAPDFLAEVLTVHREVMEQIK